MTICFGIFAEADLYKNQIRRLHKTNHDRVNNLVNTDAKI